MLAVVVCQSRETPGTAGHAKFGGTLVLFGTEHAEDGEF